MIGMMATDYSVYELCEAFGVSRSGYYAWRRGGRGNRARANADLGERIAVIHGQSWGRCGGGLSGLPWLHNAPQVWDSTPHQAG